MSKKFKLVTISNMCGLCLSFCSYVYQEFHKFFLIFEFFVTVFIFPYNSFNIYKISVDNPTFILNIGDLRSIFFLIALDIALSM